MLQPTTHTRVYIMCISSLCGRTCTCIRFAFEKFEPYIFSYVEIKFVATLLFKACLFYVQAPEIETSKPGLIGKLFPSADTPKKSIANHKVCRHCIYVLYMQFKQQDSEFRTCLHKQLYTFLRSFGPHVETQQQVIKIAAIAKVIVRISFSSTCRRQTSILTASANGAMPARAHQRTAVWYVCVVFCCNFCCRICNGYL